MDAEFTVSIKDEPQDYDEENPFIDSDAPEPNLMVEMNGKAFGCKWCDKSYKRKSHLNRHMITHTGDRPYKCDVCALRFKRSEDRLRHLRINHPSFQIKQRALKSFECKYCHKCFKTHDFLYNHITEKHKKPIIIKQANGVIKNERPHTIPEQQQHNDNDNGEQEPEAIGINENGINNRGGARLYQCGLCDKSFKRSIHLTRHRQIHYGQKFSCRYCGTEFTRQDSVNRHEMESCEMSPRAERFLRTTTRSDTKLAIKNVISIGEYQNDSMNEITFNELIRTIQSESVSGSDYPDLTEEERTTLQCAVCKNKLSTAFLLRRHKNIHAQTLLFNCNYCTRKFTRKDHMLAHQRRHQNKDTKLNKTINDVPGTQESYEPHESRETRSSNYVKTRKFFEHKPDKRKQMISKFKDYATKTCQSVNFYEDCFDFIAKMVSEALLGESNETALKITKKIDEMPSTSKEIAKKKKLPEPTVEMETDMVEEVNPLDVVERANGEDMSSVFIIESDNEDEFLCEE